MQIIAGKFRGKKLVEYYNSGTRPTASRTKEGIFNVLASAGFFDPDNLPVTLDLFAGTGQYGIEALSRGISEVVFNDFDPAAVAVIKKNLANLALHNSTPSIVFNLPFMTCLEKLRCKKFDLVFLDPPYDSTNLAREATDFLTANKMLTTSAVIVFETEYTDLEFPGFDIKIKTYGRAVVYFLSKQ